jgi:hypothetical protein
MRGGFLLFVLAQWPEPNVPPPSTTVVLSADSAEVRCPEPKVPGPSAASDVVVSGAVVADARLVDSGAASARVGVRVHAELTSVTSTAATARGLILRMGVTP